MISVVIPCYKVGGKILGVLQRIGPEVDLIIVVDDCCADRTGILVKNSNRDSRVKIIFHEQNQGVGGAMMTGYRAAIDAGADIIVKIDGDGQMDPALVPAFVGPILCGEADYTKGNRFFDVETVRKMPLVRLIGNSGLSFFNKLSSGYWNLMDPTNGYTAISSSVAASLPFAKIERGYFFESDMLFRLNTMRAVVVDIPMFAKYDDEETNLNVIRELPRFLTKHLRNFGKRIAYNYFLRNFNFASLELVLGLFFMTFGIVFGFSNWTRGSLESSYSSSGTVMLAALPTIMGLQMLLGFMNYDVSSVPNVSLQKRLRFDARFCPRSSSPEVTK